VITTARPLADIGANGELRRPYMWGTSATDVWAVGLGGTTLHYDGVSWAPLQSAPMDLYSVWNTSPSDVWATGAYPTPIHFDGNSWQSVNPQQVSQPFVIWGASAHDIWAVHTASRDGLFIVAISQGWGGSSIL
jgi:hypothetical protein